MQRSSYRFLPNVALADVAFKVGASSRSALFEVSAGALTDVMVDRRSLRGTVKKEIAVKAEGLDGLLYDFLTELIVIKDVDSLLFKKFDAKVARDGRSLVCELSGEPIDRERHKLRNDVKAVTMHMFGVTQEKGRWVATVVLDI
ncbi:MAG: archease [Thaumarchaeota archaeon]|nr:archease [Nitrososphaerota archaeon]